MANQAKLHYVYDPELKVEREFYELSEEVDGEVGAGDYVVIKSDDTGRFEVGETVVVNETEEYTVLVKHDRGVYRGMARLFSWEYARLAPTGNVRVEGVVYTLVERKADGPLVITGDTVYIVDVEECPEAVGKITTAFAPDNSVNGHVHFDVPVPSATYGAYSFIDGKTDSFIVLEPVEPAQAGPENTEELLANLVRRMAEQEARYERMVELVGWDRKEPGNRFADTEDKLEALTREMAGIKRDLETFAQVASNADFLSKSNAKDIVTLDERTQPEQLAHTIAREQAKHAEDIGRKAATDAINEYYRKGGCV